MLTDHQLQYFRTFGFVTLHKLFHPRKRSRFCARSTSPSSITCTPISPSRGRRATGR